MQALQKFAGGAKNCSEDPMVTRGLLMFQNSQKSPINNQQNLNIILGIFVIGEHWQLKL
jgi:hypothetical protein